MEETLSNISIYISLFSLVITIYIYKKFANQQVQIKQVEEVTKLVEYIHNSTITLFIHSYQECANSIQTKNLTFFEIANYGETKLDSMEIYLKSKEKCPIFFNSYVANPLIPKKIADVLLNFYSYKIGFIQIESKNQERKNFIIFSNLEFQEENINQQIDNEYYWIFNNASAYKNFGEFRRFSKLLKNEILNWYRKQGVNNINLRDDDFIYL